MPWLLSTRLNLPPPGLEECSKRNSLVMHQSLVLEQEAKPAFVHDSHDNQSYLDWATVGGLYMACANMVTCHSMVSSLVYAIV